jgi:hypothetical protein
MKHILLLPFATAFYTPGLIIENYERGKLLQVEVSTIQSAKTHIPYDYYDDANFCGIDMKLTET